MLLDLILKKPFSAPAVHIHSTHCNTRLFQYITSRNDTFLSPQSGPLSLPLDALLSSHLHPQLFFFPPHFFSINFLESANTTHGMQGPHCTGWHSSRRANVPRLCLFLHLAEPPPPHQQPFFIFIKLDI